jgi:hypothetical protein
MVLGAFLLPDPGANSIRSDMKRNVARILNPADQTTKDASTEGWLNLVRAEICEVREKISKQ